MGVKKQIATALAASVLCATALVGLSGCGNRDIFDMNYNLNYVVIEENGQSVLHQISSWSDSESDSVTFHTSCCENYIWTSANKAVLYENKPDQEMYDFECSHVHE